MSVSFGSAVCHFCKRNTKRITIGEDTWCTICGALDEKNVENEALKKEIETLKQEIDQLKKNVISPAKKCLTCGDRAKDCCELCADCHDVARQ
jgi:hypothetical protein